MEETEIINANKAVIPIVTKPKEGEFPALLGTGFFIRASGRLIVVTAKHIFEDHPLEEGEQYGVNMSPNDSSTTLGELYTFEKYKHSDKYDIASFPADGISGAIPLPLILDEIPRNNDIITHEYSCSFPSAEGLNKKILNIVTSMNKGNIIRYYTSDFPEKTPTPSFITSFPALQGASGAPVIRNDDTGVVGMIVANVEQHLLPAQIVKIEDSDGLKEEIKYFLPRAKAIASSVIIEHLQENGLELDMKK